MVSLWSIIWASFYWIAAFLNDGAAVSIYGSLCFNNVSVNMFMWMFFLNYLFATIGTLLSTIQDSMFCNYVILYLLNEGVKDFIQFLPFFKTLSFKLHRLFVIQVYVWSSCGQSDVCLSFNFGNINSYSCN